MVYASLSCHNLKKYHNKPLYILQPSKDKSFKMDGIDVFCSKILKRQSRCVSSFIVIDQFTKSTRLILININFMLLNFI